MSELCGACGSPATVPAFEAADLSLHSAPGRYTYRRCRECGSVFAAPQPSDAELAAAYSNSYGNYRATPTLIERLAARLTLPEVRRFMRSANPAGELIELGAGNGRFLERLALCGWSGPLERDRVRGRRRGGDLGAHGPRCARWGPEPRAAARRLL